jgi:hypothetical protein
MLYYVFPNENLTHAVLKPQEKQDALTLPTSESNGRPKRTIRLPLRYRDVIPQTTFELEDVPAPELPNADPSCPAFSPGPMFTSKVNAFSVFRQYDRRPTVDELRTDAIAIPDDMVDGINKPSCVMTSKEFRKAMRKVLLPFPNYSTFLYLLHDYDGITKSREN